MWIQVAQLESQDKQWEEHSLFAAQQGQVIFESSKEASSSMATPVVSGTVALIRQYFEEGWHSNGTKNEEVGFSPSAALVKAILINGAQQLLGIGNVDGNVKDYDFNQGFGRISLHNEVPFQNNNIALLVDNDKMIKNGEVHSNTIQTAISNKCNTSTFTVSRLQIL